MKTGSRFMILALIVAVVAAASLPAVAYERYDGSNACSQCHDGFLGGFGAPLHDAHNVFANCSDCHDSIGDNPLIANCATCHVANPLWNAHNTAPVDGLGFRCSTCHTFVPNENYNWGETKALFSRQ